MKQAPRWFAAPPEKLSDLWLGITAQGKQDHFECDPGWPPPAEDVYRRKYSQRPEVKAKLHAYNAKRYAAKQEEKRARANHREAVARVVVEVGDTRRVEIHDQQIAKIEKLVMEIAEGTARLLHTAEAGDVIGAERGGYRWEVRRG